MAKMILRSGDREFTATVSADAVTIDGVATVPIPRAMAVADGDTRWVFLDGDVFEFEVPRAGRKRASGHHGSLSAPMPATVVRVNTEPGGTVKRGDTLLVLEAMKMELPIRATSDGTVTAVNCRVGELVQAGVALVEIDG